LLFLAEIVAASTALLATPRQQNREVSCFIFVFHQPLDQLSPSRPRSGTPANYITGWVLNWI